MPRKVLNFISDQSVYRTAREQESNAGLDQAFTVTNIKDAEDTLKYLDPGDLLILDDIAFGNLSNPEKRRLLRYGEGGVGVAIEIKIIAKDPKAFLKQHSILSKLEGLCIKSDEKSISQAFA